MINQTSRRLNKANQSKSIHLRKSFFPKKIGCLNVLHVHVHVHVYGVPLAHVNTHVHVCVYLGVILVAREAGGGEEWHDIETVVPEI